MKLKNEFGLSILGVSQIDEESVSYTDLLKMLFTSKKFVIIHPNKKLKFVKNWENLKRAIEDKRITADYLKNAQIIDLTLESFTLYED